MIWAFGQNDVFRRPFRSNYHGPNKGKYFLHSHEHAPENRKRSISRIHFVLLLKDRNESFGRYCEISIIGRSDNCWSLLNKFYAKLLVWSWQQLYVAKTGKFDKVFPVNIIARNLLLQGLTVKTFTENSRNLM